MGLKSLCLSCLIVDKGTNCNDMNLNFKNLLQIIDIVYSLVDFESL